MIDLAVEPFDHKYDDPLLAVSITLPPWQNEVWPDVEIEAVPPDVPTLTLAANEVAEHPELFVTLTV